MNEPETVTYPLTAEEMKMERAMRALHIHFEDSSFYLKLDALGSSAYRQVVWPYVDDVRLYVNPGSHYPFSLTSL